MKRKINKKGFTLVELLAVVVILLAISVIAVSSINAAIERQKIKQEEVTKGFIVSYAGTYFGDFKNTAINSNKKGCVNTSYLIDLYNLDIDTLENRNGRFIGGCVLYDNGTLTLKMDLTKDYQCNNTNDSYVEVDFSE